MVYRILYKIFTDIEAHVYVKQKKSTQNCQAAFFDIHKQFLDPDHVARQATDAERKLQTYDGSQGTACHHGELYRLWIQWNGQWHQSPSHPPRHQEHQVGGSTQCHLGPTRKVWYRLQCNCVLSGPNGHKERHLNAIHPYCENQKSASEALSTGLHSEIRA